MEETWFQKTKRILTPMSGKERLEYIWGYYKWTIVCVLAALALVISLLTAMLTPRPEVLLRGVAINVSVTEQGQKLFTEDLFVHLGGTDPGKQTAELESGSLADTEKNHDATLNFAQASRITARIAAAEIDYLLMDQTAWDYFSDASMLLDLTQVLSEETLAALQGRLVFLKDEGESTYAAGIDLTGLPVAEHFARSGDALYLTFPGNTQQSLRLDSFVCWLLSL